MLRVLHPLKDYQGERLRLNGGIFHVVVLGNEKGGSGKSTTALHIAVALLKAGQRVATIDLDCRQQSFTRYISNRSAWARRTGLGLELPVHRCIKLGETMEAQTDFARSAYETFVAESQKIAGLYSDLAKQAFKPVETIVSKFTPAAN